MNLWKDIPAGDNPPELLNMIIEVTSDSRDKYEYSPEWDAFVLDRIIPSSVIFPVEYGFVRKPGMKTATPWTSWR